MKWQLAQLIGIQRETARIKSFLFQLPQPISFLPGQHMDIRLRAADGYEAQRSYSIASASERTQQITLTIDLLPQGEVSGFMHEEARIGDFFELKGPIGGYFVWKAHHQRPLYLIGGGSGLVPLMAILRTRDMLEAKVPAHLLLSMRSEEHFLYKQELDQMEKEDTDFQLRVTYSRKAPLSWEGNKGRISEGLLAHGLAELPATPLCYVCGPTAMVEYVATTLVDLGVGRALVRTERFG
ncbi:MAG: ferredoxin reductase [Bacteroidota bacterium]